MITHGTHDSELQIFAVKQGSPNPGPQTATGPWPVRNQATQQEVSGRQVSKASSAAPHCSPSLTLPPEPSPTPVRGKIVFHKIGPWCQKVGDCCYKGHCWYSWRNLYGVWWFDGSNILILVSWIPCIWVIKEIFLVCRKVILMLGDNSASGQWATLRGFWGKKLLCTVFATFL